MQTVNPAFLEQQLNKSERRISLLNKKNEELMDNFRKIQFEAQKLKNENESLLLENTSLSNKVKELENFYDTSLKRIKDLEAANKILSTQETDLLSNLIKRNEEVEKENNVLKYDISNLKNENLEATRLITFYKTHAIDFENIKNSLKKTISTLQNELQAQHQQNLESTTNYHKERGALLAELAKLKGEHQFCEEQKSKYKAELAQKQEKVTAFERKDTERNWNLALIELQAQIQELSRENTELKLDKEALKNQKASVELEMKERNNFYVKKIEELKKLIEEQENKLNDQKKQIARYSMDLENERSMRAPLDTFQLPLLHKERLDQLTEKCLKLEEKNFEETQRAAKLAEEVQELRAYEFKSLSKAKLANELIRELQKFIDDTQKEDQENTKSKQTIIISKLEQCITRNRHLKEANRELLKNIDARAVDINTLNAEILDLSNRFRAANIENTMLKLKLQKFEQASNVSPTQANQEIETVKDEEIRNLCGKILQLEQQLAQLQKTTINTEDHAKLESKYKELQKEYDDNQAAYLELLQDVKRLRDLKKTEALINGGIEKKEMSLEKEFADKKHALEAKEFSERTIEFETYKKKITEDNTRLAAENKTLQANLKLCQLKFEDLQAKYLAAENRMALLEKDIETRNQILQIRSEHISSLITEKEQIVVQLQQLAAQVKESSDKLTDADSRLRFYDEYSERLSKNNKQLLEEKEVFLKGLLNRQRELVHSDSKSKAEVERITQEYYRLQSKLNAAEEIHKLELRKSEDHTMLLKMRLENQDIVVSNLMSKLEVKDQIVKGLQDKLSEILKKTDTGLNPDLIALAETNSILFRSALSIADQKNIETLRELLSQQKQQFEETLKAVMASHDEIAAKFFALEEQYSKDMTLYEQRMGLLNANHQNELQKLEQNIHDLHLSYNKQLEKSAADQKNAMLMISELQSKLNDEVSKSKELMNERIQLSRMNSEMEKNFGNIVAQHTAVQSKLLEERAALENDIASLRNELEALRVKNMELINEIENARNTEKMEEEKTRVEMPQVQEVPIGDKMIDESENIGQVMASESQNVESQVAAEEENKDSGMAEGQPEVREEAQDESKQVEEVD